MRDRPAQLLAVHLGIVLAACPACSTSADGSSASPARGTGAIAAACEADVDCEPGLFCMAPQVNDPLFGGGPANGYCSKRCATHDECSDDGSALCTVDANDRNGACMLSCTIGPALRFLNETLDPAKCHGREDVRCARGNLNANVCLPTCGDDSQCPPGRACDQTLAVCVDRTRPGRPMGAPCDPAADAPECEGVCAPLEEGTAICSSRCVLGGSNDPTPTSDCGGPERGFCIYKGQEDGAGDEGVCAPACASQDDCEAPVLWCVAVGGLTGKRVENGYCLAADACPGGQSDCRNESDRCTPTRFGPFCLSPIFPLGHTAP
ncbi:hypothetical protein [Sorangium sp. So ce131]|uniref:hypothetical protein n=1 Tax=Sorangium sp. So ce131 TaxID=3133282 RepID=UPI003F63BEFF